MRKGIEPKHGKLFKRLDLRARLEDWLGADIDNRDLQDRSDLARVERAQNGLFR